MLRRTCLGLAGAVVALVEGVALACSGRGAPAAIEHAERLGWKLWAASVTLAGISALLPRLRARGVWRLWPLLLLVVIHPGLWMSARSGDCGRLRVQASVAMTALTPLLVGFMLWRARPRPGP